MRKRALLRRRLAEGTWLGMLAFIGVGAAFAFQPLPTTLNDFSGPGTQPGGLNAETISSVLCSFCHGGYAEAEEPYTFWTGTLMAQAVHDPVFRAALQVANADAPGSGDTCLR